MCLSGFFSPLLMISSAFFSQHRQNKVLLISSAFPAVDLARDKNHESM
jgi:hypothetical protein